MKGLRNIRNAGRSEAGFTLMELLVVIAILGLLTAITVPQVLKYLDHAKVETAKTSLEGISSALDLYKYDVGALPTTDQGLQALVVAPGGTAAWNGPYIKKASMLNDPWGHAFLYRFPGEHGVYDLYSLGPNSLGPKSAGTSDLSHAITNWQ
jgi:general secretion pathway protein G